MPASYIALTPCAFHAYDTQTSYKVLVPRCTFHLILLIFIHTYNILPSTLPPNPTHPAHPPLPLLQNPTKHHPPNLPLHTLPRLQNPPISTNKHTLPNPIQSFHTSLLPPPYQPLQPIHIHPNPPRRFTNHPHLPQDRFIIPIFQSQP